MQIIKDSKIDFINNSRFTILLSGALILAGIFSLIINNGPKLSIDFKGGTLIAVQYTKPININDLRFQLKNVNIDGQSFDFSTSEIKHFGDNSNVSVRIANLENEPEKFSQNFIDILKDIYPDALPEDKDDFILSIDKVGPKIGSELSGKAIMAIIYAITLILIYISFRFEFTYAIGAIAAIGQKNLKRLVAYSSIGHMGYALAGLSTGTNEGIQSSITYITIYLIMNLGLFSCLFMMKRNNRYYENIDDLSGLSKNHPLISFSLLRIQ